MIKFERTIGLNDTFPFGYLAGATVREAIMHDPAYVKEHHCVDYVLNFPAIKLMVSENIKRNNR